MLKVCSLAAIIGGTAAIPQAPEAAIVQAEGAGEKGSWLPWMDEHQRVYINGGLIFGKGTSEKKADFKEYLKCRPLDFPYHSELGKRDEDLVDITVCGSKIKVVVTTHKPDQKKRIAQGAKDNKQNKCNVHNCYAGCTAQIGMCRENKEMQHAHTCDTLKVSQKEFAAYQIQPCFQKYPMTTPDHQKTKPEPDWDPDDHDHN